MSSLSTLRALGPGPEVPDEIKQRIHRQLLFALGSAPLALSSAPPAASNAARLPVRFWTAKSALVVGGMWLLGALMGVFAYSSLRPAQVRVVYVDRTAPSVSAQSIPAAEPSAPLELATPAAAAVAPIVPAPAKAVWSAPKTSGLRSDLGRERALLDIARQSAAHGEPAQELSQVTAYQREFPHGRLAEEAEALAIRALLSLGQKGEAYARASAFREKYPDSFLTPAIEPALTP